MLGWFNFFAKWIWTKKSKKNLIKEHLLENDETIFYNEIHNFNLKIRIKLHKSV